jgi:hypothetical protein
MSSSDCTTITLVRARKDHSCECHREFPRDDPRGMGRVRPCEIRRGDVYEQQSGIFDGEPYRQRLCLFHAAVCAAIWADLHRANWMRTEGIDLGTLGEYVEIASHEDWRKWLGLIRDKRRKLKERVAGMRRGKPAA